MWCVCFKYHICGWKYNSVRSTQEALGSFPASNKSATAVYACHPTLWRWRQEDPLIQGCPWLYSEFQASLGAREILSQKKGGEGKFLLCPLMTPNMDLPSFSSEVTCPPESTIHHQHQLENLCLGLTWPRQKPPNYERLPG